MRTAKLKAKHTRFRLNKMTSFRTLQTSKLGLKLNSTRKLNKKLGGIISVTALLNADTCVVDHHRRRLVHSTLRKIKASCIPRPTAAESMPSHVNASIKYSAI